MVNNLRISWYTVLESPSLYMNLQSITSKFPYLWGKFRFSLFISAVVVHNSFQTCFLQQRKHLCFCKINLHCKDTIPKIRNKYSQKRNSAASVTISTLMCPWTIYIFPRSVCIFCSRKIFGPIMEIYKSLTDTVHECGNWNWGRAIPFLGMHKWDFRCSAFIDISNSTLFFVCVEGHFVFFKLEELPLKLIMKQDCSAYLM